MISVGPRGTSFADMTGSVSIAEEALVVLETTIV